MAVSTGGEWLALPVAALRLNSTVESVRQRVKSGELRGRRVGPPGRRRWEVRLDGGGRPASATGDPAIGRRAAERRAVEGPEGAPGPAAAPSSAPSVAPRLDDGRWLDLMRDLVAENDALGRQVARLSDERAELYGRCGYLQGQLAAAQAQVRALEAPASAAAAEGTERRRWWRFFRAG